MTWFQRTKGPDEPQEPDFQDWYSLSQAPSFPNEAVNEAFLRGEKEIFLDSDRKIDLTKMLLIERHVRHLAFFLPLFVLKELNLTV
jgi:hypothetical protein